MARNFTIAFEPASMLTPSSGHAQYDVLPTTGRPCMAFSPSADESIILEATVPVAYTGSGTLKLDLFLCANTTTAADDARFDVTTEFRTAGAGESMNADNFDGTPDSVTATFSATAYALMKWTVTITPATTPAAGDKFRIKITRDADNGGSLDDLATDALLVAAEFYEET